MESASESATSKHPNAHLYPRVTSFRSRRSALTESQQETWDKVWPTIGADVNTERLNVAQWFAREADTIMEIGCGTGTAAVAMALAEPDKNLIACDVYVPGLAQLVKGIDRENLTNIRCLRGDAVVALESMIAPNSLTGVRVFFPDPWPKARHHKRRLLKPDFIELVAKRLQPGGVLHIATDHAEYAAYIADVLEAQSALVELDWDSPMNHERPVTKFEDKAHRADRGVTEFVWGKVTD